MAAVADTATVAAGEAAESVDVASGIDVMAIAPAVAHDVWPHISGMIEAARTAVPAAIQAREHLEDVLEKIKANTYQLWLICEGGRIAAVAVTSVDRYSRATVLTIQYMGGRSLESWLGEWTAQIAGWARDNGCTQIEARGRLGWGKKLAPLGAEIAGAAYVLEIAE